MLTLADLRERVKTGQVDTVLVVFPDLYGRLMGKRVTGTFFLEETADGGMHVCDYLLTVDMEMDVVDGYTFANWQGGYGDVHCVPDWSTLRQPDWLPGRQDESEVSEEITGLLKAENDYANALLAPIKELRKDCEKALSILGVKPTNIYLGDFPDNEMDKHSLLELIHWLEKIIDKIKPDLILTHHRFCTNIDHQYCHEAVVVATRPSINSHIPVFCGEVPSSTGYLKPVQWEPNYFVNVTEKDIDAKILSMQTFKNEARPDPHPRSPEVLKSLAKVRGSEGGFFFAEAFMIEKIFSK